MRRYALITGASSAIARSLAEHLAADGTSLILAARDEADMQRSAADVRIRYGVDVAVHAFDASDPTSGAGLMQFATAHAAEGLEAVILCHGILDERRENPSAATDAAASMMQVNFLSAVPILEQAAAHFRRSGRGAIVAIGSVAGDRARASNFRYGTSKAALAFYLAGLRHDLAGTTVRVITVKPGFVDTKMTWGRPGMSRVASPDAVARDVAEAMRTGKAELYTPWFWRWIMLAIRSTPWIIFKRLRF